MPIGRHGKYRSKTNIDNGSRRNFERRKIRIGDSSGRIPYSVVNGTPWWPTIDGATPSVHPPSIHRSGSPGVNESRRNWLNWKTSSISGGPPPHTSYTTPSSVRPFDSWPFENVRWVNRLPTYTSLLDWNTHTIRVVCGPRVSGTGSGSPPINTPTTPPGLRRSGAISTKSHPLHPCRSPLSNSFKHHPPSVTGSVGCLRNHQHPLYGGRTTMMKMKRGNVLYTIHPTGTKQRTRKKTIFWSMDT